MNFCWTTLHVSNLERSLAFYRDLLGIPVVSTLNAGPVSIAFIGKEGNAQVELLYTPEGVPGDAGRGISIGFMTEELDALIDEVRKAGYDVTGPFSPGSHISFYFVGDPDGFQVQLCTRL